MFMRRRRPLARAAIVGGVAYHAGKKVQEGRTEDEMTQERLDQLEAQQYAAQSQAPAPQASGGLSDESIQQLQKLAELKTAGVLTEDEFNQQKQRLLQGS
jgi:Short C-terminal domain